MATSQPPLAARPGGLDLAGMEARWQRSWQERKVYEAHPEPGRPKFFCTYPYSYMNAFAHVGHAYTMGRVDFMARYQRMLGKNVLFPFAYHVTGTPIVAAANRVREGEPGQVKLLLDQGIPRDEVQRFADPIKWVEFFPQHWRHDVDRLGLAIDWRRQFHTTDLNPHYDSFIRWQFRKLKEKGYVRRGKHPVIWCPKDNAVVADHDRTKGEGETPQEYVLIKLRDAKDPTRVLVAATLRPETMFGQTNVWVHPDETYTEVQVGDERWLVARACAGKLPHQIANARPTGRDIPGRELVGLMVKAPSTERQIPVLPGTFVSATIGTGVVTSVPSDAPDDYRALKDLQEDARALAHYKLDAKIVGALKPIAIIDTPELGDLPAVKLVEERGIKSQAEREKLHEAKEEVYKRGFYGGVMKASLPLVGGKPVQAAKDEVKAWLIERGDAATFWEPSGEVICRCLTPSVVRIVDDQWFMAYGHEEWKEQVRHAFETTTRCYPPKVKQQFLNVVDWLKDWACVRASGLGTHLPWDEQWIIESLSDSTIYMAYYTVAHILESGEVKPEDTRDNDAAFDYVFLGKGDKGEAVRGTLGRDALEAMRQEFTYWYPLDFRNSGKDLVQNHLTFMVYNHAAVFPEDLWPRGISVNGWVTVDGEKMSKSRGNFIMLREALDQYGATVVRLTLANAGEGLDDANFDRSFSATVGKRVEQWFESVTTRPATPRTGELTEPDAWYLARLSQLCREARSAYEEAMFRSALKVSLFEVQRAWAWYLRRCLDRPHEEVWATYASTAIRLIAPLAPHLAAEAWERIAGEGDVIDARFPDVPAPTGAEAAVSAEAFLEQVLEDVRDILKVTGAKPNRLRMFTAPAWKRRVVAEALAMQAAGDKIDPGTLTKRAMALDEVKEHAKDAAKFCKDVALAVQRGELRLREVDEKATLTNAKEFLASELGCPVEIFAADAKGGVEDGGKAARAEPGRPGIYVET